MGKLPPSPCATCMCLSGIGTQRDKRLRKCTPENKLTLLKQADRLDDAGRGWYICREELPTPQAYKELEMAFFTRLLTDVVDDAQADLEALRDELQDWYDNLPENFQAGDKGDQLQEAIDQLE